MGLQGAPDDSDNSRAIPVRCRQRIVGLAQGHETRPEHLPGRLMRLAAKGPVRDRHDGREHVLDAMLQFRGEKMLAFGVLLEKLGRVPFFRDVARDRQQMRRLAIVANDGRNLNVPIARVALGGVGRAPESRGLALPGAGDSGHGMRVSLAGPELRPGATLQHAEIVDLHHALAALAHEDQAAVEIEDLDAIAAAGQHAAQQIGVAHERRAGVAQFAMQSFDGRYWVHGLPIYVDCGTH